MKSGRETRKRVREPVERTDVQASEARRAGGRPMDSCFEIAHVTWTKRLEQREPVVLGHASEPMS
jgi:hypothetical protein